MVDVDLGPLWFPADDAVMSDWIEGYGCWDKLTGDWLTEEIFPGATCLNIGANVGYFTCVMSRLVGAAGRVIAVEPRRDLVTLLKLNIKSAALPNVKVHNLAATSTRQKVDLYINPRNAGDNRVFDPRQTTGGGSHVDYGFSLKPKRRKVRGLPVDDILGGEAVDFCLIDAQGWEHEIIRGMVQTLSTRLPTMVVEFTPDWIFGLGEKPHDVLREYENLGYHLMVMGHEERGALAPSESMSHLRGSSAVACDLILKPK